MFIYVGSLHAENKEKKIIYGDVFFNPLTSRGWVQYLNGETWFLNLNAHGCFQTWKWLSELYAPRMHSKAAILTLIPSIEHYTDRESLIRSHLRCFHGQESKRILSTKKKKKSTKLAINTGQVSSTAGWWISHLIRRMGEGQPGGEAKMETARKEGQQGHKGNELQGVRDCNRSNKKSVSCDPILVVWRMTHLGSRHPKD